MDNCNQDHDPDVKVCNKTCDELWLSNYRPQKIDDISFWIVRHPWMCKRCLEITAKYMLANKK